MFSQYWVKNFFHFCRVVQIFGVKTGAFWTLIIQKVVNSHGIPFFYNRFEVRVFECWHYTLSISTLLSGLMWGICGVFCGLYFSCTDMESFLFFYGFYLQFGFASAWFYDFAGCKFVRMPKWWIITQAFGDKHKVKYLPPALSMWNSYIFLC